MRHGRDPCKSLPSDWKVLIADDVGLGKTIEAGLVIPDTVGAAIGLLGGSVSARITRDDGSVVKIAGLSELSAVYRRRNADGTEEVSSYL